MQEVVMVEEILGGTWFYAKQLSIICGESKYYPPW